VRVLAACSLGGAGHLHPLLPFLDAARRRGDDTLVVGPAALAGLVDGTGHPFAPGGEPPEAAVASIRERLPVAPRHEASVLGNRELFGRLATAALLPEMARVARRFTPDLVLRDPTEFASAIVARDHGLPVAQTAIGLAEVEWGSIAVAAPALDEHRPGLADAVRDTPYLTRFPASLDPSSFPDTRRFRAPPAAAAPAPLPDWWSGSTAPLVYASFGTVLGHMTLAADAYRMLLRAVAPLAARVLLTVGRQVDPATLGPVPAHVRVERWVDQDRVLPEAAAVVCHGGSGTTYGALAAGVPVVIVPLFADQFANAAAVAGSGAGLVVGGERDADRGRPDLDGELAARITDATATVLADPAPRAAARRIAAEMAAAPTVAAVLDELAAR
jgi:UDP:flavonoid glycosyltransferase YjiC (YdhE family)